MTHKFDKASAETLDKIESKETVDLAQRLTYVFVARKISEFTFHVFGVQIMFISTIQCWVFLWSIS